MNNSKLCYWCGAPAESREHVPPSCFFPKELTQDGIIQKLEWNHLLTVPSCKVHNNRKPKDDEYLLAHIAPFALENQYAQALFEGKVLRAWSRKKDLLKPTRLAEAKIYFDCNDNKIGFEISGIARALYLLENRSIFVGKCSIFNMGYTVDSKLFFRNSEVEKLLLPDSSLWNTEIKGYYPAIFKYQFSPTDQLGCTALMLTFYESFKIYVVLADEEHYNDRINSANEALHFVISKGINPLPLLFGNQGYNEDDSD